MQRIFVILALATMLLLMGNAPPPYYACQGKAAGDACYLWLRRRGLQQQPRRLHNLDVLYR